MRIVFDGTTLRPRRTGVGYYTEHLLWHLAQEAAQDEELVVVSNRPIDTTRPLPARVRVAQARWRMPQMVWMQMLAPRLLRELRPDVAHFTNGMLPLGSSTPSVVTIHDMSLTLFPKFHPPRRVLLNRPLVDIAARRAAAIITVSESAKRDIVRLCELSPDRVHVVHEAAAPSFQPVSDPADLDRVRRRYALDGRIILYVGTVEPRKNLVTLIDAFARRRHAGDLSHRLVCVGPYGWLSRDIQSRIERLNVADAITFTDYVPFADLPALYTLAEFFVFPSVYEGFGLPVVEAMACGLPVITGPTSSLREIAGGAIVHVDPLDADSLGAAMVALAANRERREHLSECGIARARLYSWRRAARETLEVYRQAARQAAGAGVASRGSAMPPFADVAVKPATPAQAAVGEPRQPWVP
jgi:glycosyltransferase involved in cell wall biosynthesis